MRGPHPLFAAFWLARYFGLLAALASGNGWWVLVASASFLPVEAYGIAKDTGLRDTFSEIVTWVVRHLSKHERPFRGWNLLVPIIALPDCYAILWMGSEAEHPLLGAGLAGMAFALLNAHWLRPDVNG